MHELQMVISVTVCQQGRQGRHRQARQKILKKSVDFWQGIGYSSCIKGALDDFI
jgi:hypothetical protein